MPGIRGPSTGGIVSIRILEWSLVIVRSTAGSKDLLLDALQATHPYIIWIPITLPLPLNTVTLTMATTYRTEFTVTVPVLQKATRTPWYPVDFVY